MNFALQRKSERQAARAPESSPDADLEDPHVLAGMAGGGMSAAQDRMDTAGDGVEGSGQALPFLSRIQESFGQHGVSGARAHTGPDAEAASGALNAEAYTVGEDVAFADAPDLHTAAHEAAHVVQQRSGVSLKGGMGQSGDAYEAHADAVADEVVAGGSAEALLDAAPGGGGSGGVQREEAAGEPEPLPYTEETRKLEIQARYRSKHREALDKLHTYFASPDDGEGLLDSVDTWLDAFGDVRQALQDAMAEGDPPEVSPSPGDIEGKFGMLQVAAQSVLDQLARVDEQLPEMDVETPSHETLALLIDVYTEIDKLGENPTLGQLPKDCKTASKALHKAGATALKAAVDGVKAHAKALGGWRKSKPVKAALKKSKKLVERMKEGGEADETNAAILDGQITAKHMGKTETTDEGTIAWLDRIIGAAQSGDDKLLVELEWQQTDLPRLWKYMGAGDLSGSMKKDQLDDVVKDNVEQAILKGFGRGDVAGDPIGAIVAHLRDTCEVPDDKLDKIRADLVAFVDGMVARHEEGRSGKHKPERIAAARQLRDALEGNNKLAAKVVEAGKGYPMGLLDYLYRLSLSYKGAGIDNMFTWYETKLVNMYFLGQERVTVNASHAADLAQIGKDYMSMVEAAGETNTFTVQGETGAFNFRGHRAKVMKKMMCRSVDAAWNSHHSTGRAIDVNYGSSKGGKQNMFVTEPEVWAVVELFLKWFAAGMPQTPSAAYANATPMLTADQMASGKKSDDVMNLMLAASNLFKDPGFESFETGWPQQLLIPQDTIPSAGAYNKALDAEGLDDKTLSGIRKERSAAEKRLNRLRKHVCDAHKAQYKGVKKQIRAAKKQIKNKKLRKADREAYADQRTSLAKLLDQANEQNQAWIDARDLAKAAVRAGNAGPDSAYHDLDGARGAVYGSLVGAKSYAEAILPTVPEIDDGDKKQKGRSLSTALQGVIDTLDPEGIATAIDPAVDAVEAEEEAQAANGEDPALQKAERGERELAAIQAYAKFEKKYIKHWRKNGFFDLQMLLVHAFEHNNWTWGGRWSTPDFMHFQRD